MSKHWKVLMIAICFSLVFPSQLVKEKRNEYIHNVEPQNHNQQDRKKHSILILAHDGSVTEMEIEDYITGVVLGEMPADFSEEALKAQAVVSRTYALHRAKDGKKHVNADVCTDATCCQAYISEAEYLLKEGKELSIDRVKEAVHTVEGVVLTYKGALIEATYFSCSGGATENAVAVWGSEIPYLVSVDSPGEESSKHYSNTSNFTAEELADKLDLTINSQPSAWVENISYTEGGGVNRLLICGKEFSGTEVRRFLDLKSTAFRIDWNGAEFLITTNGYGHRVGMSQYGAEAMAKNGATYEEILLHYYTGVQLSQFSWDD